MPRPLFVRFADLTEAERGMADKAVRTAYAADTVVRLNHKARVAVIVAAVRSMDAPAASRTKVVRYFTVN